MMSINLIDKSVAPSGFSLFNLGFRPFYLGGAIFGALAILLWMDAIYYGVQVGEPKAITGMLWHTHEMIFGFAAAIIAGFLLTAVRAWTGINTPHGKKLALIFLLWIAGRLLIWTGPEHIAAVVDCAFLPITAIVLIRILVTADNRRNYFLAVALCTLGLLNMLFHYWVWQSRFDLSLRTAYAAIGFVIMFVTVIGGRVIPMFTTNAIQGFKLKRWKTIETLAAPIVIVTFLADATSAAPWIIAACDMIAVVIHSVRIIGWHSWTVGYRPILTILHIAYAWIPAGFLLLALASMSLVSHSLAMHAFTVGAMGCAIIAMITRTALGHTGRLLIAGTAEVWCYGFMFTSAVLRVFGPWLNHRHAIIWVYLAAVCWIAALSIYVIKYTKFLIQPRVDGKAG